MKKLILILCSCLVLAGCSDKKSAYIETLEIWRDKQNAIAYAELQKQYIQVSANLTAQLNQSRSEVLGLQATTKSNRREIDSLKSQIDNLPTIDEMKREKQLLGDALTKEANASKLYEIKQRDFEAVVNDYLTMRDKLGVVVATYKEIVLTGNFTDNQTMEYLEIIRDVRIE